MEKLKMVKNEEGKSVPFYADDNIGKMNTGGEVPVIEAKKGKIKRKPTAKERKEGFKGTDIPKEKVVKKRGGSIIKKKGGAKGGKVRGAGMAKKGVRAAKMVVMKGS